MRTSLLVFPLSLMAALNLSGCTTVAQPTALVVNPSLTAQLPDGSLVHPVLVVPAENVLGKNAAYQQWEAQWPAKHCLRSSPCRR